MIKWKIKPENSEHDEFYFSKNGFCIKTSLDGSSLKQGDSVKFIWHLQIYYYTKDKKSVICQQNYYAKFHKDERVYESNVKQGATKIAKKFMWKYANRANSFFGAIAS